MLNGMAIPEDNWKRIQEEARKELDNIDRYVANSVAAHWKSIASGKIPFGCTIRKE